MLKPKRKITRHNLKEDKFVKTTLQVKTYFDENYTQVVTTVLIVFAVVVFIIGYRYYSEQAGQEANTNLGIAQVEYTNGNLDKAMQRLLVILERHSGSDAADQAIFLLANIYYQQKNYEQASFYFEEFVDSYSGSDVLLASGYAGLAACREIEENFVDAGQYYEHAADIAPNFSEADNYRYLSGLSYKKANDYDRARSQFKQIVDHSNTQKRKQDAEKQIVLLGQTN
jgi:outer membrane protein assembly factor BamD (BamD/ComL family)